MEGSAAATGAPGGQRPPNGNDDNSRKRPLARISAVENRTAPTPPLEKKRKLEKKGPALGSARAFPCASCVSRAVKNPGHECCDQDSFGLSCWDCSKNGHSCLEVPLDAVPTVRAFWDLNSSWERGTPPSPDFRTLSQRAIKVIKAARKSSAPSAPPSAASIGKTLEERKVEALEQIAKNLKPVAQAAKLFILMNTEPDDDESGPEKNARAAKLED